MAHPSGLEHPNIIDVIALDPDSSAVTLVMRETRPWTGSTLQLFQLQEKMNAYVSFALDGEMHEAYPEFRDRPVRIQIHGISAPDAQTNRLIAAMRAQLAFQDIAVEVKLTPADSECCSDHGCSCDPAHGA